ncbi:MAG: HPP family protein, partial [Methylobacter sp.]|nr:HPP family protein [Methylobacter sp.]
MTINQLIRFIIVEPVNLKFKDKLLAVGSSFCAILIMALVAQELVTAAAYPVLIASMGASAVILFVIPGSPLAQPWSLLGGHLVSAIIGVVCAQWLADIAIASACAVSGSIFAMLLLRCLHPPGAATALVPVLSGGSLGYGFVLMPVGLNVLVMLVMAIIINRWLLRHDYPTVSGKKSAAVTPERQSGISDQDLKRALNNMDMFMDVSAADLRKLLNYAEIHSFQRVKGNIT